MSTTLDLLQWLMRSGTGGPNGVGIGVSKAIYAALEELHTTEKTAENTDQLMVCTVCISPLYGVFFLSGKCKWLL